PAFITGPVPAREGAPLLRFFGGQPPDAGEPGADGFDLLPTGPGSSVSWSAHAGPFPTRRRFHATVFDPSPAKERVLVLGGDTGDEVLPELWSSPLRGAVSWTRETTTPALPPLTDHSALSLGPGRV